MRAIILIFAGLLALAAASSDKKVVCYFGSWAIYRPGNGKFDIEKIDPNLCTHLIYTFIGLNADGTVRILDSWADLSKDYGKDGYGKINILRNINPNLKTMIAMGGWNEGNSNSKYSQVMADPSLRTNLVNSIVEFVEEHDFNGFDLDWEYPGTARAGGAPEDRDNLVLFLQELKEAFEPKGLILSAAVAASQATAEKSYNIAKISKYLDFINMMEYDFHNYEEHKTGHNGPLYSASSESDKTLNVDASIQYWIKQGAPAEKIVMGIPLYGKGFALADSSNNGVNAPASGPSSAGPYTQQPGMLGYNEICENINEWQVVFDEEQRVPYAYNGNQWVSYDNERSITEKGDYVKKYGLGGMMVWSLETDDFRGICGESWPLLKAINNVLDNKSVTNVTNSPVAKPKPSKAKAVKANKIPKQASQPKPTAAPVQANQSVVVCQGPGFVRDPKDCTVFYQCVFDGYNYNPVRFACPAGLAWDGNVCNFKLSVQC